MLVKKFRRKHKALLPTNNVYIVADIYLQIKNCASVRNAHTYLPQHKKIFLLIHHLKNEGSPYKWGERRGDVMFHVR
jgi:hypothetical protein